MIPSEVLTWSALIGAAGSIIAVLKFWMDIGKADAESKAIAENAKTTATIAIAKVELAMSDFVNFRVSVAREYVSHDQLRVSETRMIEGMDNLRVELRGMNERLDRIIDTVSTKLR